MAIAKLAQEMGTPVIFVRTKAMNDFKTMRAKREYKNLGDQELIKLMILMIKDNINKELKIAKFESPKVFVIEAHSLRQFSDIGVKELPQLEDIIKFEELHMLQYVTELASVRSGLSLKNLNLNEEFVPFLQFCSATKSIITNFLNSSKEPSKK